MLYSNVILKPENKDGKYGIFLKTCDKNRPDLFLPVSKEILYDIGGFKNNLNIEVKNGIPSIITKMKPELYLILATEHDLTSPNHGIFGYLRKQNIEFIGRKYFRDQGREQIYIIKAKDGDLFRITWGDSGRDPVITYYLVDGNSIDKIDETDGVINLYEKHGKAIPFHYQLCPRNRMRLNYGYEDIEWYFV